MGGGKTPATINILDDEWKSNIVLILAPKAVVSSVWPSEIEKFSERPWRVIPCAMSGTPRRIKTIMDAGRDWKDSDRAYPIAFVLNYEAVRNAEMFKLLSKIPFDSIVCDESHRLKGPTSKTSKAVAKLVAQRKSMRRIGLTGTLMPHSPLDIYAQMRVINPDVFGKSFYRFRKMYSVLGGFGGKQVVGYRNMDEMMDL